MSDEPKAPGGARAVGKPADRGPDPAGDTGAVGAPTGQWPDAPGAPTGQWPDAPGPPTARSEPGAAVVSPSTTGDGAPSTPPGAGERRPLVERIGLAAIALLLAILFGGVSAASWVGGEPFLAVMGGVGCLMTLWVGAMTLVRG
jgi:hypothetical protein